MLHSIWLLTYHDFQGLYVVTEDDEKGVDLEAVLMTPACDPSITITKEQLYRHGICVWSPERED